MGRRSIGIAVLGLVVAATSSWAADRSGPIDAREHNQRARIHNGVVNGELTRGERSRLAADEAAIRAEERVYRRTGGGVSGVERRDLQRDLNHASREIYRAKHNRRTP